MNKLTAIKLRKKAEEVAKIFSDPLRDRNLGGETFELENIDALSENTAAVVYLKSSGKKAIAFFYFNNNGWWFFFPTDSHLIGMLSFAEIKKEVEGENFEKNFMGDK